LTALNPAPGLLPILREGFPEGDEAMKRILAAALFAAAAGTAAAQAPAALRADMIALDRAYIPALAVTNRADAQVAARAMKALTTQWRSFEARHAGASTGDPQWAASLKDVDGYIERASRIVAEGRDLPAAHDQLEGVRGTLLAARDRMKMPYYLDGLTRYHDRMEAIYLAAKGKDAATLDDSAIALIRGELPDAQAWWRAARAQPIEPEFGVTPQRQAEIDAQYARIDRSLAELREALSGTDKGAIAKAAQGLRPPFSALFASFGDFGPVQAR
jgi:hypothetical protein